MWHNDRSQLLENSQRISAYLRQVTSLKKTTLSLDKETLDQAVMNLAQAYDWENGGWGKAPKFPQAMVIEFLLQRSSCGDRLATDMALHVLRVMAKGGMYDVIGGGFARYATDDHWCVPHFEKMLYDNAQLALAYLHGWLISGEVYFRQVCVETLDFILRELCHPLGGFYSSLDADSEGEEGKFYTWTLDEIQAALQDPDDFAFFSAAYHVTAGGNFEGRNVLQRVLSDAQLAERFNTPIDFIPKRLGVLHQRLLAVRSKRVRPATDDKVLTSWNALTLAALAEAGRYLSHPDYLLAAQRNANFLLENLTQGKQLWRSWRAGQVKHRAYLEDYAALILGLLALFQSDANLRWYTAAIELVNDMIEHFADPEGGFFDTRDDHEALLFRPKNTQDNATPCGNALAAFALLQLAAYEGRSDWHDLVEEMLSAAQEGMRRYPTAYAQWLRAADLALGPSMEIAILGDLQDVRTQALLKVLWENYRPHQVVAISSYPPPSGTPTLLRHRQLEDNLPTAYVCQGFVCKQATNSPEELQRQLAGDQGR